MTNSNYDIWAIQHQPEEVYNAIEGLENSKDNTLFTNCRSYLRVGEKKLYVQFDTVFISEDSDRLIMLQKDGKVTPDAFRTILNDNHIPYNEVQFMKTESLPQEETKEIWFAREKYVLEDALKDSTAKGVDTCTYYPNLSGRLEFRYPVSEEEFAPFERQAIRGAMLLEDKIILLMSNSKEMNIKYPEALRILYEQDVTPLVIQGERELPHEEVKQYKKER